MTQFSKGLEQYVSIDEINQLVKDIEENMNSLLTTPRDITFLKEEIEKLKAKIETKTVDISTVEVINDPNSLSKSSSGSIPKLVFAKKK